MELEEITTNRLNSTSQIKSQDQTSSRFIDRFIRLKTRYWNRGFAIVFLTCIGSLILQYQCLTLVMRLWNTYKEFKVEYFNYGMCIGLIPGGVLATVYPAHKVFGISFILSTICQLMEVMNESFFLSSVLHYFFQFCMGTTMAIANTATHRVCTFWIPLNKNSLRYVPIVLWTMTILYTELHDIKYYDLLRKGNGFLVMVESAWFVLWLFVVSVDFSQSPNHGFILFRPFRGSNTAPRSSGISLRRSNISDIPWKSLCTSMPVIAIVLSYICYTYAYFLKIHNYSYYMEFDHNLRKYTTIFLLLLLIILELVPELTVCFSVTNVRKFFSCTVFIVMSILFFLKAFEVKTFLFLEANKLCNIILSEIEYFVFFGFNINHLDIAPKYASVLYGFQLTIYNTSTMYLPTFYEILSSKIVLKYFDIHILIAVIYLAMAVFYVIFASAEIQPWAEDKPVKENQRTIHEEEILSAV